MMNPEHGNSVDLEIECPDEPLHVWRVGFSPELWAWTPWPFAGDDGLFSGRWDDQLGEFRTIYTAESLLGCFLELLAHFRPSPELVAGLDQIIDDDGSIGSYSEAPQCAIGYSWLEDRRYGSARQSGKYCYVTHSRSIAALSIHYPFDRHDISLADVDTALLKDARDRVLTRSIARWLYDLHEETAGEPVVDGVRFNSRHGDEIRVWAVFERADDLAVSPRIQPVMEPLPVPPDLPELQEAFARFGLQWHEG